MKFLVSGYFVFLVCNCGFSQKPVIDFAASENWITLDFSLPPVISDDGNYVAYLVNSKPAGNKTLIVQSTNAKWKKEFTNIKGLPVFTPDSKRVLFIKGRDSLMITCPGSEDVTYINGITSFEVMSKGKSSLLIYQLGNAVKELIFHDLTTGKQQVYSKNICYLRSPDNRNLLLVNEVLKNANRLQAIQYLNLANDELSTVWEGNSSESIMPSFNITGDKLAFVIANERHEHVVFYAKLGHTATEIFNDNYPEIKNRFKINDAIFAADGQNIQLTFKAIPRSDSAKGIMLDIWAYTDNRLKSDNLFSPEYLSIARVSPVSGKFSWIRQAGQAYLGEIEASLGGNTTLLLSELRSPDGDGEDSWRSIYEEPPYILYPDGSVDTLPPIDYQTQYSHTLSPNGNYLLYYEHKLKQWLSYDIKQKKLIVLTKGIDSDWLSILSDLETYRQHPSLQGWLENGDAIIMDAYDMWRIDPSGNRKPINLTGGYGKRNHIIFQFALLPEVKQFIDEKKRIILTGFDVDTKENGFYSATFNKPSNPELLSKGDFAYANLPGFANYNSVPVFNPLKAKNASVYLVRRMTAEQSPNYFCTKDFKSFTRLSDLHPEQEYNWLTTELMSWTAYDGKKSQGILYKPENFNPHKKYPVIFFYYETMSDALHVYRLPFPHYGAITIPWLVSRGYLVFTPDIHYRIGHVGESAYDYVVSAADKIGKLPYVDSTKMAITGVSHGGYETNYLVTHTGKFAAAYSGYGKSDLVRTYGDMPGYTERSQLRMGKSLWEIKDQYIKNSPIFEIDKVTTPLLIMANKRDKGMYEENIPFFKGLRRLGKISWLLQYDKGDHGFQPGLKREKQDFTIRLDQFFDHYLKGAAAPIWMLEGIPNEDKGYKTGLELDTLGRTPQPALHTRETID